MLGLFILHIYINEQINSRSTLPTYIYFVKISLGGQCYDMNTYNNPRESRVVVARAEGSSFIYGL